MPLKNPMIGFVRTFTLLQPQPQGAQHRRDAQCHQHRANHREGDGVCERLEQLAFHALQGEDRQEDGYDDENREEHRPPDFLSGDQYRLAHGVFAVFFKMAINVFDHHDGRIDHHADAYRQPAKRSEIGRKP